MRFVGTGSRFALGKTERPDDVRSGLRAAGGDPDLARRLVEGFEAQGGGWFWETDRTGRLTYLSDRIAAQVVDGGGTGFGQPLTSLFETKDGAAGAERTLLFHLGARASFADYEVRRAGLKADDRCWSISGRPWFDAIGQFRGFVGSGCDLTDKRRSEAEITRLTMFDPLTGLANRTRMHHSLGQALSRQHGPYRAIGLLVLDLDRFKAVNDTLGHQTGDALLQQVGQRLQRAVGDAGLVGRLGGDEFQVIVPLERHRDELGELARAIIAAVSHPYFICGSNIAIGCSIGIAAAPHDGEDAETLARNADLALYAAKAGGRGVHRFFRQKLLEEAQARKLLEDDLRRALERDQLHVVYQPVVSTHSAEIVGYEALIRWQHPTRGPISPADFIPVAEEAGLIDQIGEWVLRTACMVAATWPAPIRVAVNVSPIQFGRTALPAIVTSALANAGLEPGRLELEITEGVLLDRSLATEKMFVALKGIGVRLALDDFGTGYSSLGYLRTAPFDKIKIDQSFVRGARIPGNRNAAIIKAIVTLAGALGMETTAEGVEVQDEIELIRDLGCSHIQGFVYGRPARAEAVAIQLRADRRVEPIGAKTSREPRATMLRSAMVLAGERRGSARIRNISPSGTMIDRFDFGQIIVGAVIEIEIDGGFRPAQVRWVADGKAGLAFGEH